MDNKKNMLESEDEEIAHLYAQILYEQKGRDVLIESFELNETWRFSHIYKGRVHLTKRRVIYINGDDEKFIFNTPYTLDPHES